MKIHYEAKRKIFWAELDGDPKGTREERNAYWGQKDDVKKAGFRFDGSGERTGLPNTWFTVNVTTAEAFYDQTDSETRVMIDKERDQRVASRAMTSDLDIPAPVGLSYHLFQKAGVQYIEDALAERQGMILADDMGLGKTIMFLGYVNRHKNIRRVLVICPPNGRINWIREAKKWLVDDERVWKFQRISGNQPVDPEANFVVVGWSNLASKEVTPGLMNGQWDIGIQDEAHYAKNTLTAARAKIAVGYWDSKAKKVVEGLAHKMPTIFTTGTPIPNRPKELFPMLAICDPQDLGRGFLSYAYRYCDATSNGYGSDFNGASNLDELQRKMRGRFMIRRKKQDVMSELPDKVRTVYTLDPKDVSGATRLLNKMKKVLAKIAGFDDAVQEGNLEEAISRLQASKAGFEEISLIRHELGRVKIKPTLELCEQALQSNNKIIVFAHHRDVQDAMRDGLASYGVVQIKGGMSDEAKAAAADKFQTDDSIRVFAGSIDACREVITLTKATTVIFAELPWRPSDVAQAEDRAYGRVNDPHGINSYYVVLDDSLDAYMAQVLAAKEAVIYAALDEKVGDVKQAKVTKIDHNKVAQDKIEEGGSPMDFAHAVTFVDEAQQKVVETGKPVVTAVQITDADLEQPPF